MWGSCRPIVPLVEALANGAIDKGGRGAYTSKTGRGGGGAGVMQQYWPRVFNIRAIVAYLWNEEWGSGGARFKCSQNWDSRWISSRVTSVVIFSKQAPFQCLTVPRLPCLTLHTILKIFKLLTLMIHVMNILLKFYVCYISFLIIAG